eukprot:COSAG06_NODE_19323_length_843_cov_3.895161_1_plen_159_part_00
MLSNLLIGIVYGTSAVVRSVENFALQTDAGGSVRFRPRQLNFKCASIGFVLIFDVLTLSCVSIVQSGSGPLSLSERFTQVQLANEARSRGGRGGGGGSTKFTITTMGGGGGGAGAAITSPFSYVLQNVSFAKTGSGQKQTHNANVENETGVVFRRWAR